MDVCHVNLSSTQSVFYIFNDLCLAKTCVCEVGQKNVVFIVGTHQK